jgi:hypothetical protein
VALQWHRRVAGACLSQPDVIPHLASSRSKMRVVEPSSTLPYHITLHLPDAVLDL